MGIFFFPFYMSVYHKANEAYTHCREEEGGKQAGAPCKLLLWTQCVFMSDDGRTPPDNNWHVYKWSLTGDAKPIRPICHIRSSRRGAHTHTRTFQTLYFDRVHVPLLTNCAQTQHKQPDRLPQLTKARDACPQEQTLPYIKSSMTF